MGHKNVLHVLHCDSITFCHHCKCLRYNEHLGLGRLAVSRGNVSSAFSFGWGQYTKMFLLGPRNWILKLTALIDYELFC